MTNITTCDPANTSCSKVLSGSALTRTTLTAELPSLIICAKLAMQSLHAWIAMTNTALDNCAKKR